MDRMTKRSLASLVLKLVAVYFLISFVPSLSYVFSLIQTTTQFYRTSTVLLVIGAAVLLPLLWVGLCLLLIRFAGRIASRLVPEDEEIGAVSAESMDGAQRVVLVSIGVLLAVRAIPLLVHVAVSYAFQAEMPFGYSDSSTRHMLASTLCSAVAQVALGALLLFRPGSVLTWIQKLQPRKSGKEATSDGSEQDASNESCPSE